MSLLSNYSLAVFITDPRVRCISVSYDRSVDYKGKTTPTELKSFKTFDSEIKKGDYVVVPTDTRWGMTVGRVEEVDKNVNFTSTEEMRWVVAKINKANYDQLLEDEKKIVGVVAQAEETAARRELAEKLKQLNPNIPQLGFIDTSMVGPAPLRAGEGEAPKRGGAQMDVIEPMAPPPTAYDGPDEDPFA